MHGLLGVWIAYLIGQVLHILKRAQLSSWNPATPGDSIRAFLRANWVDVLIRFTLCTAGFIVWASQPQFVEVVLEKFGASDWLNILQVNVLTAMAYGFAADSVFDYVLAAVRRKFVPC